LFSNFDCGFIAFFIVFVFEQLVLLKKVCYKVSLCVKAISGKVVRHSLAELTMRKWLVDGNPCTWNFGSNRPRWSEITDFLSLFARSDSAI